MKTNIILILVFCILGCNANDSSKSHENKELIAALNANTKALLDLKNRMDKQFKNEKGYSSSYTISYPDNLVVLGDTPLARAAHREIIDQAFPTAEYANGFNFKNIKLDDQTLIKLISGFRYKKNFENLELNVSNIKGYSILYLRKINALKNIKAFGPISVEKYFAKLKKIKPSLNIDYTITNEAVLDPKAVPVQEVEGSEKAEKKGWI